MLAHFTKVDTALFDVTRVLKPGGRIAFSAWSDGLDAYQETWRELIESVVPREMLGSAYAEVVPGHERFRSRTEVEEALIDAGFRSVRTEITKYRWTYSLDDYLDGLQVWATGRFVRNMLGDSGWNSLQERARDDVRAAIPRSIERLPRRDPRDRDQAVLSLSRRRSS